MPSPFQLSLYIPNAILIPCYGTLLVRVYRGSNFVFVKQIGWLLLVSSAAGIGWAVMYPILKPGTIVGGAID